MCLGFKPGAAGWKARTNPLSYGGTPCTVKLRQALCGLLQLLALKGTVTYLVPHMSICRPISRNRMLLKCRACIMLKVCFLHLINFISVTSCLVENLIFMKK